MNINSSKLPVNRKHCSHANRPTKIINTCRKSSYSFVGIYDQYFFIKKSPSLNLMTIVRNVFWIYPTILRWKGHHFYFFFSWHIKQTDQKALSLHLTAIVWANSFSAPFCSSITLNITVAAFYLSHPFSHHCHPHHYRPMPSWMPGQSSFLFRWTSSAQRAADWIYKHKEMCSLIQSGYPWQGIFGWNTIF